MSSSQAVVRSIDINGKKAQSTVQHSKYVLYMPHHQSTVTVIEIKGRAKTLVRRRYHFQGRCLFFGLDT